jgi:disulfide oxidoreductase YuzD
MDMYIDIKGNSMYRCLAGKGNHCKSCGHTICTDDIMDKIENALKEKDPSEVLVEHYLYNK